MFVGIAGIVVLFANLWSRRFRKGPLEYIWDVSFRSLTRRLSDLTKHVGP